MSTKRAPTGHLWDRQERSFSGMTMPKLDWPSTPWLYLYGDTGGGKTTVARWWVQQWERWEFCYCVSFVDELRRACQDGQGYRRHLDRMYTHPRMVIDELGNEGDHEYTLHHKGSTKRGTPPELFEQILHRRHEAGLWTIITSNLSPFWRDDPDTGGRVNSIHTRYGPKTRSRLMEFSTVYNFRGDRRMGERFSLEMKHQGTERTDVPFGPPPPLDIEPKQMTKKEVLAASAKLDPENPFKQVLRDIAVKMSIDLKKGRR